jgi:hypothetical protein
MEPARENMKMTPMKIDLCPIILSGTVAFLGLKYWTAQKASKRTPKTTRRVTIQGLLHVYVDPPHSSANRRTTMLGMNKKVPRGSSRTKRSHRGTGSCFLGGNLRQNARQAAAKAPIGRLM